MTRFTHAIVRLPGDNFADGLTREDLGTPSLARALEQHASYCQALRDCGLALTTLPANPAHPDGTFVEDTAILLPEGAILTRPGADARRGEVAAIAEALRAHYPTSARIEAPGSVDGGDICEAGRHVFIGLSHRTNEAGAAQLARWLASFGYTSSTVDVRKIDSILHLKSGISWLGDGRLLVIDELAGHPAFAGFGVVRIDAEEAYAANAIRVNDTVLIASGFPRLQARLEALGYRCLPLAMSEYAKMDGGLSCLSLRF
jgi:dimethylargininase